MPFLQDNLVSNFAPSPLDQAAATPPPLAPSFTRPEGSLRRNGQLADADYGTTPTGSVGPLTTSATTSAPPSPAEVRQSQTRQPGSVQSSYGDRIEQLEGAGPDPRSNAVGGFMPDTWTHLIRKYAPQIAAGRSDQDLLALRDNQQLRVAMNNAYAAENGPLLQQAGFRPDPSNLRLAHWFGPDGAIKILKSPLETPVSALFSPAVIDANPSLKGLTVGQLENQVDTQMSDHGDMMAPLRMAARQAGVDMQAANKQAYASQQQLVAQYAREASEALPGSKEREEALNRQLAASEEMTKTFDEIAKHPPQYTPMDVMGRFGSIATVLAVLGGLKSRQPLTAALGAAGSAMQALNQQNYNEYKIAFNQWKAQSDLAVQSIRAHSDAIRNILEDKRLTQTDRDAKLRAIYSEFGMETGLAALQQNNIQWPFQQQVELQKLSNQFELAKGNMERLNAYLQLSQDRLNKPAAPKEYEITTPDGQKSTVSLMQDRQGFLTPDGQRYEVPTGASMKPIPPSLGRQAATQVARIQGAANELAGTLANLVDLPISSTTGWLMGAQMHPPEQLGEAARRSLSSHLTDDEVKSLLYSSQGVPRFLAQLESLGAATGLVGLSNQARMALPASGDDGYEVLRKYAELRQIVDRSLETAKTLPGVSDAQKAQFDQITEEVHGAVPWTVKDVNALQHNPSNESVAEFAKRVNAAGASGGANYATPDDVYKAFDAGKLTSDQAKKILIDRFGAKAQ